MMQVAQAAVTIDLTAAVLTLRGADVQDTRTLVEHR
jgi:hypothetical protein